MVPEVPQLNCGVAQFEHKAFYVNVGRPMDYSYYDNWLENEIPRYRGLTQTAVTIVENLLKAHNVPHLLVTGRTKDKASALQKIEKKSYRDPANELTDLSGVRVIAFFESDVRRVAGLIESSFNVDVQRSLNKDNALGDNKVGYRSIHFICDLGKERTVLPEFREFRDIKFECQVRTVLQHAWAELEHDRNYKFAGVLPRELKRRLYLYAGLLEVADKGFDSLAQEIDTYEDSINEKVRKGELGVEIDSFSLQAFMDEWASRHNVHIMVGNAGEQYAEVIQELKDHGIYTLTELKGIVPENYAEYMKKHYSRASTVGTVRIWMLINDWRKVREHCGEKWVLAEPDIFAEYFDGVELQSFIKEFCWMVELNKNMYSADPEDVMQSIDWSKIRYRSVEK